MTFAKKGNIRLNSIIKLDVSGEKDFIEVPTKDGLGLEYCYDGEHYIVIAFIKYNKKEGYAQLENVVNRILDISASDFDNFKELAELGIRLVEANQDEED